MSRTKMKARRNGIPLKDRVSGDQHSKKSKKPHSDDKVDKNENQARKKVKTTVDDAKEVKPIRGILKNKSDLGNDKTQMSKQSPQLGGSGTSSSSEKSDEDKENKIAEKILKKGSQKEDTDLVMKDSVSPIVDKLSKSAKKDKKKDKKDTDKQGGKNIIADAIVETSSEAEKKTNSGDDLDSDTLDIIEVPFDKNTSSKKLSKKEKRATRSSHSVSPNIETETTITTTTVDTVVETTTTIDDVVMSEQTEFSTPMIAKEVITTKVIDVAEGTMAKMDDMKVKVTKLQLELALAQAKLEFQQKQVDISTVVNQLDKHSKVTQEEMLEGMGDLVADITKVWACNEALKKFMEESEEAD